MKYTIATFLLAIVLTITTFAQDQVVNVGEGGLKYSPAAITATSGSTITFTWINTIPHAVIQSDSADSCTPTAGGFNVQMKAGETWKYIVPTDKPKIWFYCNVSTHCQQGMKGVLTVSGVSPPSSNSSTSPGDSGSNPPNPPNRPPTAKIAGIIAAGIVLLVGVMGVFFYRRKRRLSNGRDREKGNDRDVGTELPTLFSSSTTALVPSLQYPDPDSQPSASSSK